VSLDQFISQHQLTYSCHQVQSRPDGVETEQGAKHFRCHIGRLSRSFGFYFSETSTQADSPTLPQILERLVEDARDYENAEKFEDWAQKRGYDIDSRKAEKQYRVIKRQSEQLKRSIGREAYEQLLSFVD